MHALYIVSVWLHIVAATAWVGGMFFIMLVAVPWLRSGGGQHAGAFLRETGLRFRRVGWGCFTILLLTGTFNLWVRGVRFASFTNAEWLGSPFGKTVTAKLTLFLVVLAVSTWHDFVAGPRATRAITRDVRSPEAASLRRQASFLGRANALLALVLLALGVMLVRGVPW
jgi:uncharacterized membrane protein